MKWFSTLMQQNPYKPCIQQVFVVVVVTNQSVVARGLTDLKGVEAIHARMERLLAEEGAFVDQISFCPHHPDKGYPEEVPAFKIDCHCRKPKPGMLLDAATRFNIDCSNSWTGWRLRKRHPCRTSCWLSNHSGENWAWTETIDGGSRCPCSRYLGSNNAYIGRQIIGEKDRHSLCHDHNANPI